jgi:hypothetical protein
MRSTFACRVFLAATLLGLAACSAANEDETDAESAAALTAHPVFTRHAGVHGGNAAAWFDSARGGVFSLNRTGTDRGTWTETRFTGDAWVKTAEVTTTDAPNVNTYDRFDYGFAYDDSRGRVVVVTFDRVWAWSGGAWTKLPAPQMPPARSGFGLVYDSARDRIVLHGGMVRGTAFADTWEYDGSDWTQVATNGPARMKATLAFDRARGKVVAYGGSAPARRNDTWEWDGSSWQTRATTGPDPAVDWGTFAVYDEDRSRVTMFGNQHAWEWSGTTWSSLGLSSAWPGLQMPEGLAAYDAARKQFVLWSGQGTIELSHSTAPNAAPTLEDVEDGDVYAGEITTRQLTAQDVDGDALHYSAAPLPTGATMSDRGLFWWKPDFDQIGATTITFSVDDGGRTTSRSATIRVLEPVFADWLPRGAVADESASVTMNASQTDERTNGSTSGNGTRQVTAACSLQGENPRALSIACDVSGSYNGGGTYGTRATGRVNGAGNFYADGPTRGTKATVRGRIEQDANGALVLVVTEMLVSIPRRFGMTGWPGYTTLRTFSSEEGRATF